MTGTRTAGLRGAITVEHDRTAGDLTASEVRGVVAGYLAPWEVAQLARAIQGQIPAADTIADLKSGHRGYAGKGTQWETTGKGIYVRINDPDTDAGYRTGLITWRLLRHVVADGISPTRISALHQALSDHDHQTARQAARDIVTAGATATQLDLLDTLTDLTDLPETAAPVSETAEKNEKNEKNEQATTTKAKAANGTRRSGRAGARRAAAGGAS